MITLCYKHLTYSLYNYNYTKLLILIYLYIYKQLFHINIIIHFYYINNLKFFFLFFIFFLTTMPRGRPRQLQSATDINTTNAPNAANAPRTINFNYSENFNRITELFVENYIEWTTNILYLLCINNLDSYVTTEKLKKIRKKTSQKT